MDKLKEEIARKRKQLEDTNVLVQGKKYFKRGDLISKHEEEYLMKHAPQKLAQSSFGEKAVKDHDEQKKSDKAADDNLVHGNVEDLPMLSRREVIRRLRERGEPVFLFGETEASAFMRLRKMEILEPEVNRGFRNDLQAAFEQVDQAYLEEILQTTKSDTGERERKKLGDVKINMDEELTYDEIREAAKEKFRKRKDFESHSKIILTWFKFLLKTWGQQLNSRPEDEKLSVRGKLSSATYTQTVEYLKPLFKKLKQAALSDDLLESMTEIVSFMLDKEYIKANDSYLEMAIGNAPWPIGVTMVGIHARTGREKIFSKNLAHVMNDETQRKYIQALKRLITKCQYFFPGVPSKSVEFDPNYIVNT